jgi:flagellar basal-body rod protein FlgB
LKTVLGQGVAMKETHPRHLPTAGKGVYGLRPEFTQSKNSSRIDGNNVDLDQEFAKSAENSSQHQVLLTAASKHLKMIKLVIDGAKAR